MHTHTLPTASGTSLQKDQHLRLAHTRTHTLAWLRPPHSTQQLFAVKNTLSMSGHIAALCHFNYGHKALSSESIIVREGIQYHQMIGLYVKTSVPSPNIGVWIPVIT